MLGWSGELGTAAERVLEAYLEEGDASFERLRGRFALIVIDRRRQRVLVVRDPMGEEPVFYAEGAGALYISPSAEVVARRDGQLPVLDRLAAAGFLSRTFIDGERTFYGGVKRLLQGHLLELRAGRVDIRRYWEPNSPVHLEDATLDQLVGQSVRRSGGIRRGVFLSGGLDSALVAAVAAEEAPRDETPVALSIGFRGTDASEEQMQREVASRLGLEHVICSVTELLGDRGLLEAALELGRKGTAHPPELLTPVYDELARHGADRGCDVVLTGAGGDEWLMPPPGYAVDRLRTCDISALAELTRAWRDYWPQQGTFGSLRAVVWDEGARPLLRSFAARGLQRLSPARFERRPQASRGAPDL